MARSVKRVIVNGVVWYDVTISVSKDTTIIKRLTEEQVRRLRDDLVDALRDTE